MRLFIPKPEEGTPQLENEIAWRRELKQLRTRVQQLEAERSLRQDPSIGVKKGEPHGYRCGMPCTVYVYDNQPLVECQACGTMLDPVQVLRDYAEHERNFCYSLTHLREEQRDLMNQIDKLKGLRARLRAECRKMLPEPQAVRGDRKWDRDMVANEQLDRVLAKEPTPK